MFYLHQFHISFLFMMSCENTEQLLVVCVALGGEGVFVKLSWLHDMINGSKDLLQLWSIW